MSTNSRIIVKHPKTGMYASVYCHSDGYLDHNGVILHRCFDTIEKVAALISLGDLSYLGQSYETALSYHRWRDEEIRIRISPTLEDHNDHEYNYLFAEGAWYVYYRHYNWRPLEPLVVNLSMPKLSDTSDRWDGKVRLNPPSQLSNLALGI